MLDSCWTLILKHTCLGEPYNYEFVKRAITMSMDKHEKERESVSRLLSELYLNGLSPLEISQGFRRVLISADDLALDIPSAINMLSIFAARAVVDEIVPPKFLEDSFLLKNAEPVVAEAIKKLSIKHGTVRMEKGWGPGDGRPVEELKVLHSPCNCTPLMMRCAGCD